MKRILISDTHYGVKNNSITWMRHQMDFIHKQLIPYIKKLRQETDEKIVLYHLGDVFDSRSSINPMVASNVREAFMELHKVVDCMMILGGNHDYYSPADDGVNSIDMILHHDINTGFKPHIITHSLGLCDETLAGNVLAAGSKDLFIPWFEYDKVDEIRRYMSEYKIKNVFCHADLTHIDPAHKVLFENVNVYSGHIHTPCMDGNLHTLGSTYALTFADHDAERGFYVLDDDNNFEFIANKHTICFWRFYDDKIFEVLDKVDKDDYIELYIKQSLLMNEDYINEIQTITKEVHNTNVIPVNEQSQIDEGCDFDSYDIIAICRESIPENLQEKFKMVTDSLE